MLQIPHSMPLREGEEFFLRIRYDWQRSQLIFTKGNISLSLEYIGNTFDRLTASGDMSIGFLGFVPKGIHKKHGFLSCINLSIHLQTNFN